MRKLLLLAAAAATADDAAIIEGRKFAILLASNVPDQNPGSSISKRQARRPRPRRGAALRGRRRAARRAPRALSGRDARPAGSLKNAPAALTWDIRLALQLHDAILTPDDLFWVEYGTLLPKVEEMGLPLLKRGAELDVSAPGARRAGAPAATKVEGARFPREVLPARRAGRRVAGTLPWAWAPCGRAFGATATQVNFDDGTSGTTDRFAFVPFVDMANQAARSGSAVVDAGDSSGCARRGTWRRATP